jgi:hypothetical protein
MPRYMERHREKAGMTGWAQVNGLRGDTSIEERTKYDLWYIENWSVWLDVKIILRTDPPALSATQESDGGFTALLDSAAPVTVNVSHRGYGLLPPLRVDPAVDSLVDLTLPPRADLARNGGFETGALSPWSASGRLPVALTAYRAHTGQFAALLGAPAGVAALSTERAALSQTIVLPPPTTRPHLSFYASSVSLSLAQLRATVDDAGERRILPLKRSNHGAWLHFWADLTQWGGLSVIVTIEAWEAAGPGTGQIAVDDISVGEWHTPGIDTISPRILPGNRGVSFSVSGDNFEEGITAMLNGLPLSLLRSPWMLEARSPATLGPGVYELWIENPGGEAAATEVTVGLPIHLPLLLR